MDPAVDVAVRNARGPNDDRRAVDYAFEQPFSMQGGTTNDVTPRSGSRGGASTPRSLDQNRTSADPRCRRGGD